jgi:spermidine synthase
MNFTKRIYFLLFLASGFCGLTYQIIWVRLAFSHFGVITPVLSVVISVFMLGLALGSWAAGLIVKHLASKTYFSPALWYAISEALIGVGAFAVPWLLTTGDAWLLSSGGMNSFHYLALSALTITCALFPWCFFMGTTYPFMMAFVRKYEKDSSSSFSFLYLANVVGAMIGTILTANVLIESFGFHGTLMVAGVLNFVIAGGSLWLGRLSLQRAIAPRSQVFSEKTGGIPSVWIMSLLFMSGFVSLSLEVIWTRAFTPILNTTIYAFALVLAIYLAGTALGSIKYRQDLSRRIVRSRSLLFSAITGSILWTLLTNDPRLNLHTFGVEVGIFPFCFLLGYFTPQLVDEVSQGNPQFAAYAYAINVLGCIVGPLVASYLLLPAFGVKTSTLLLGIPFFLFWVKECLSTQPLAKSAPRWILMGVVAVATGLGVMSHEEKYPQSIVRRDYAATVISTGEGLEKHLYVNGQGITALATTTKCMAHLPLAALRYKPEKALTICFGMGTTYRSLLTWEGLDVTAVELVPSVREAFSYYHPDASAVLSNSRGHIIIDDGRRFLRRTRDMFDVIVIDPPPPIEAAGSSLLYSKEMYAILLRHLNPDGILQQWFPGGRGVEAEAIARSLSESFPYVRVYQSMSKEGFHFLASRRDFGVLEARKLAARMPEKTRQDISEWEPLPPQTILGTILSQELPLQDVQGHNTSRIVNDDRPYNEYYWLRRTGAKISEFFR